MRNGIDGNSEERLLGSGTDAEYTDDGYTEQKQEAQEEYYDLPPAIRSRSLIWSVAGLVLGALSILLCSFYYVSFVLAVGAVVLALIERKNLGFFDKFSIMGIILGIMGFVCGIFSLGADLLGLFK